MSHINNLSAEFEPSPKSSMLPRHGISFGPVCGLSIEKKINLRLIVPNIKLTIKCTINSFSPAV